ncbi:MAG: hypothetical protein JSV24_03430, partial [Bacteroidales bacterium]
IDERMAKNREFYKEYDGFSKKRKRQMKEQYEAMDQEQTTMMVYLEMLQAKLKEIQDEKAKALNTGNVPGGTPTPEAPSMAEALEKEARALEKVAQKARLEYSKMSKRLSRDLMEDTQEILDEINAQFEEEDREWEQWLEDRYEFQRNMLFNYTTEYQAMLIRLEDLEEDYQRMALVKDQAYYNAKKQIIGEYVISVAGQILQVGQAFSKLYKSITGEATEVFDEFMGVFDGVIAAIEGYYSGNTGQMLSGILGAFDSLYTTLDKWINEDVYEKRESYDKWLDSTMEALKGQNRLLERQLQLVREIAGIRVFEEWDKALKMIEKELKAIEETLTQFDIHRYAIMSEPGSGVVMDTSKWSIDDFNAALADPNLNIKSREAVQELIDKYYELIDAQKELQEQINESITQTTTDSIADSIVQGFAQGKYAAQDFADDFETMMKNAIMESFKKRIVEDQVAQFYEQFVAAAESGGALNYVEIEELQEQWNAMIEQMQGLWSILTPSNVDDWFGTGDIADSTLRGAIKGITEETAGVIAGQMNAIRMNVAEGLAVSIDQLQALNDIVINTRYNRYLETIDQKLSGTPIDLLRADGN